MKRTLTRDEVIDTLLDVFRRLGYDGSSLSELSNATGLGKSSLYHYFPGGKEQMGRTVLQHSHAWLQDLVARTVARNGTPQERLGCMLAEIGDFYDGGRKLCVLGIMTTSGGRSLFAREVHDSFRLWIDALTQLATEAGVPARKARVRAEDAVAEIQGTLIVSTALGEPGPFQRLLRRLPAELYKSG